MSLLVNAGRQERDNFWCGFSAGTSKTLKQHLRSKLRVPVISKLACNSPQSPVLISKLYWSCYEWPTGNRYEHFREQKWWKLCFVSSFQWTTSSLYTAFMTLPKLLRLLLPKICELPWSSHWDLHLIQFDSSYLHASWELCLLLFWESCNDS